MSNLEDYARSEMQIAGLFDADSDYGGALAESVLKLIKMFSDEGHSGASAGLSLSIFEKVARFQPLTPLTGEDSEWTEVGDGVYQNNRCFTVFKDAKHTYDINGKVFRTPNGSCYTSRDSRVAVTFPYVPKTEYVDVQD
jgi:hypothetical protein